MSKTINMSALVLSQIDELRLCSKNATGSQQFFCCITMPSVLWLPTIGWLLLLIMCKNIDSGPG